MDINTLRERYQEAVQEHQAAKAFWEELKGYRGSEGIVLAYKASARALLARFDLNPYNKLKFLKEANKLFREAVKSQADNIEIRFLRFAVQHYMPDFLGESKELKLDMQVMQQHFNRYKEFGLSEDHAATFYRFFEESKRFTPTALTHMREVLIVS